MYEMFDLAFEGTAVRDCLRYQEEGTECGIVMDTNETYGSTYKGYLKLKHSRYVRNCVLHKSLGGGTGSEVLIEALPCLVRPSDGNLLKIKKTGMMELLQFIKIENHFYIDVSGGVHRIPYTRTDIAESSILSLREKSLFNRFLGGRVGIDELVGSLSERTRLFLTEGIMCCGETDAGTLERYVRNFGNVPFIYPQYGLKEISEVFARSNSMCGTAYVLDPDLCITTRTGDNEELFVQPLGITAAQTHTYRIDTKYGTVFAKRVQRSLPDGVVSYVRVVNIRNPVLGETFFASVHREEIMKVIGINSDSECCHKNTYLVYVIKTHSHVTEDDLRFLGIQDTSVIEDISYETVFSFSFDSPFI